MSINGFSKIMVLAKQINTLRDTAENLTELMVNSIVLSDHEMAEIFQRTRDAVVKYRAEKLKEHRSLYEDLKHDPNFLYSVPQGEEED